MRPDVRNLCNRRRKSSLVEKVEIMMSAFPDCRSIQSITSASWIRSEKYGCMAHFDNGIRPDSGESEGM